MHNPSWLPLLDCVSGRRESDEPCRGRSPARQQLWQGRSPLCRLSGSDTLIADGQANQHSVRRVFCLTLAVQPHNQSAGSGALGALVLASQGMRAKWYTGAYVNRESEDFGALGLHLRFAALVGRMLAAHVRARVHAALTVI